MKFTSSSRQRIAASGVFSLLFLANPVSCDDFQGYRILTNGLAQPESCPQSSYFFTTSTFGGCCSGTASRACNFATACRDGTVTFLFNGGQNTCGTGAPVCFTRTVFPYPSASSSWSIFLCTQSGRPTAESLFIETTSPGSSPTPTSSPPSPSSGITGGPAQTTPSSGSDSASTSASYVPAEQTGDPQPKSSGSSKAWIAGAVIGPIAGIAIVGFLGYWLGMRKARAKRAPDVVAAQASPGHGPAATPAMSGPNTGGAGGYYNPKPVDAAEAGAGGADQYKYYYHHAGNAMPPPANHHLDSTPVHELSHTAEAQELPADYGPGHGHYAR